MALAVSFLPGAVKEVAEVAEGEGVAGQHEGLAGQIIEAGQQFLRRVSYYIVAVKDRGPVAEDGELGILPAEVIVASRGRVAQFGKAGVGPEERHGSQNAVSPGDTVGLDGDFFTLVAEVAVLDPAAVVVFVLPLLQDFDAVLAAQFEGGSLDHPRPVDRLVKDAEAAGFLLENQLAAASGDDEHVAGRVSRGPGETLRVGLNVFDQHVVSFGKFLTWIQPVAEDTISNQVDAGDLAGRVMKLIVIFTLIDANQSS